MHRFAIAVIAASLLAADFTPIDLSLVPDDRLDGAWLLVEESGGPRIDGLQWVITGARFDVVQNKSKVNEAKLKIDLGAMPKKFEIRWKQGNVVHSVVQISGDRLVVLMGKDESIYRQVNKMTIAHRLVFQRVRP